MVARRIGRSKVASVSPTAVGSGMKLHVAVVAAVALCAAAALVPSAAYAQEIDFGQIDKFESVGTGTLHVGAPPKTIVDDGEQHVVILTIWNADAETKVYWKTPDGNRITVIPANGVQTFKAAGEFKLEAIGDPDRRVDYGYVLLGLKKH